MNPILLDIPESFETARLTLRCPQPGDGPEVFQAVQDSLASLLPWMPWVSPDYSLEQAEEYVRLGRIHFLQRSEMPMLFFLKGTNTLIGSSGYPRLNWNVPKFEIGYWCRQQYQGQGYVTEAAEGLTNFAFEQLGAKRVDIWCDEQNLKSVAVAERLGFVREARLVSYLLNTAGQPCNFLIYAKTSAE